MCFLSTPIPTTRKPLSYFKSLRDKSRQRTSSILLVRCLSTESANIFWKIFTSHTLHALIMINRIVKLFSCCVCVRGGGRLPGPCFSFPSQVHLDSNPPIRKNISFLKNIISPIRECSMNKYLEDCLYSCFDTSLKTIVFREVSKQL